MRKIREVLRLKAAGLSDRKIAAAIGSARSTVQECLRRASEAGLVWPLAEELDEQVLQARLYRREVPLSRRPAPDFDQIHAELGRRSVTRLLLWQEYKATQPDGWQYSVFCEQYRRWLSTQELVLRQHHVPGDKLFVDYAGQTVSIIDRYSGEISEAQIFVAVLGCSNYTYAEATLSQKLADWLGAHVRALEFIGGVPLAIVPDNLRSAVKRAHRYEPELNPSYHDFAEHYGVAILPARVRKPRDKAKVEAGVLVVERWILARLRNRTFFSLAELNTAISQLLEELNTRPFKKLEGCRRSRFLELEQSTLRPLPAQRYEISEWRRAKVHPDYHIEVKRAYYSVPYRLIGQQVEVRLTADSVEVFHGRQLVAAHARCNERGRRSTRDNHRPPRHTAVIRLRWAKLPISACLEDLDTRTARGIDPASLSQLTDLGWIREHLNVLITGPTGVGKSYIGSAFAHAACRADFSVRCFRLPRLIEELARHAAMQKRSALYRQLAKADLLVIDDFGLAPRADETVRDLLEILDDRYDRRSTLITSQLPVDQWHAYLGDRTVADAILDRLVHNSYRLVLKGESMRKRRASTSTSASPKPKQR